MTAARVVPVALLVLGALAACSRPPPQYEIGVAINTPFPNGASLAKATIEAQTPRGSIQLHVTTGELDSTLRGAAALARDVARALNFSGNPLVLGVVGPGGSREALQTAPVYRDAGMPNVVPTSTSSRLKDAGPWTFRLVSNDSVQGDFIAGFAAERLHAKNALLFYIPDEYGLGLAAGTVVALRARNVRLLDRVAVPTRQSCTATGGDNPYARAVDAALRIGRPDVVIIAGRTVEAACISRATRARLPAMRFIAGDGTMLEPQFFGEAGGPVDSMYLVAFWHPDLDSASRAFAARFQASAGREARHDDALYYDGLMLLATAIRSVGADRGRIQTYFEELGRTRPAYPGITGTIAFHPGATRPLLMTRLQGRRTVVVPAQ